MPRRTPSGFERGLLAALIAFRWAAIIWSAVVLVVTRHDLDHTAVAVVLLVLALCFTAMLTIQLRRDPAVLTIPATVLVEVAIGAVLLAADGYVYRSGHPQSFGSAWPLAGVLSVGMVMGPVAGIVGGIALGVARAAGGDAAVVSTVSSGVLYALAGGVGGYVVARLRRAEATISAARAREEVARTLHDGVLQTLAIVQRRTADPSLAKLAREQERELREYLFGSPAIATVGGGDIGAALRAVAARTEDRYPLRVQVVSADDLPAVANATVDALAGAVGEALTNAAKHAAATHATVYVEPAGDGELFCSVKDDGSGFDSASVEEGVGLTTSVRGRVTEVGGRVEVAGNPGRGTEVRIWVRAE